MPYILVCAYIDFVICLLSYVGFTDSRSLNFDYNL